VQRNIRDRQVEEVHDVEVEVEQEPVARRAQRASASSAACSGRPRIRSAGSPARSRRTITSCSAPG
jgi:hypothetical protein